MRLLPTSALISSHKNISKMESLMKERNDLYERTEAQNNLQLNQERLEALKAEVVKLFEIISQQDKEVEEENKKLPSHYHILINRVKNRHKNAKYNRLEIEKCIKSMPESSIIQIYKRKMEDHRIHQML